MRPVTRPLVAAAVLLLPLAARGAEDSLADRVERMARVGRTYGATFSPDGKRLAVLSDLSGVPQVWVVPVEGGWPQRVTATDDPVSGVEWSPRGDWLSLSVDPGGGLNSQLYVMRPDGSGMRRLTDGGEENNWLGSWAPDGRHLMMASNRRDGAAMDVWVLDTAGGEPRLVSQMASGIQTAGRLSADGRRTVLFRMKSRSDNDLYLLDVASGRETLLTPHTPPARFSGRVSPDGTAVYLAHNLDRDRTAFGRIRLAADGTPQPIETIAERADAELDDVVLDAKGSQAALLWNAGGRNELAFVDLATGASRPGPQLPAELASLSEFSPDGSLLAFTASGSAAPLDVWVLETASGRFRQLSRSAHAGVDLAALVRPELVTYSAHDGLELSGWLYRPPAVTGAAPFVLSFHGGPEGQERPAFRADYQALLASGIGVFAPNVRGSSGFGKRFVNLDNGALRRDGVRDIEASVRYLVDAGIGDPKRLGITGGSYGGYMTMAGLTRYPELFAAGVNLFGVVNFATFFAQSEPWMAAISTVEYGDPKTQADLLAELSPIHQLDRIRAPLMVQHGANDTNVPVVEAAQIVESLQARGVPVDYILFPDEGHGWRKTANRVRSVVEMVAFFTRHLRPDAPATPATSGS